MDAASGLAFLHNRDVLHRDIKADNLLVFVHGDSLTVKLGDFGTALRRGEVPREELNATVGSVCWHAPELAFNKEPHDRSSDVWAFGVTMTEILTHSVPWEDLVSGESDFNLLAVSQGRISPLDQLRPDVLATSDPDSFDAVMRVISQCCEFDKHARPDMKAVLFDLLQLFVSAEEEPTGREEQDLSAIDFTDDVGVLSTTNVDISPDYSPVFDQRKNSQKRISDPTYASSSRRKPPPHALSFSRTSFDQSASVTFSTPKRKLESGG
jgi:serine/threonine protein kinase